MINALSSDLILPPCPYGPMEEGPVTRPLLTAMLWSSAHACLRCITPQFPQTFPSHSQEKLIIWRQFSPLLLTSHQLSSQLLWLSLHSISFNLICKQRQRHVCTSADPFIGIPGSFCVTILRIH